MSALSKINLLNYQEIAALQPTIALTPCEKYFPIRANLILGRYETAQELINNWKEESSEEVDNFYLEFLLIQLAVLRDEEWENTLQRMIFLTTRLPGDKYFQAEFQFIMGLIYNLRNEFHLGIPYHSLAAELYREAGLIGPESIALYNLGIATDNLGRSSLRSETLQRLKANSEKISDYAIKMPYLHMASNIFLADEQFEDCLKVLEQAEQACTSLSRVRDLVSIYVTKSYVLIKLGKLTEFTSYCPAFKRFSEAHAPSREGIFLEFEKLSKLALITSETADELCSQWKKKTFRAIDLPFLYDLLLEKIWASKDFGTLKKISIIAERHSLQNQQSPNLIDFRYYQILGAIHLGELHEAGRWLCAYELDSIKRNNPARIKKAHELRNLIKMINEEISGSVSASLVFDKSSISIVINGSRVSLSKRPLVFRLLEVLALHPEPQNLEKVFFAVYGTIYTQENHGRRFHSLLDRTRGLRNEKNWIIRSDGTLSLHPSIKTSFIGADASALVNHRRKQLKKMLPLYSKGASISDLEKSFNVTRRTIQSDLSTLSAKGEIVTTGITRNKRYSLGEISYA